MRCMSTDSPASVPITNSFPRRVIPVSVAPSTAEIGGSNERSALMPGVSTDSIRAPATAEPIRRAVISTSGSSGMATDNATAIPPGLPGSGDSLPWP